MDWLMNEEGDMRKIDSIRNMVGENTKLYTCLANRNEKDQKTVVPDAIQANIGLFGFTKPDSSSIKPHMDYYYSAPIDSFEDDVKIIATFARVFNEKPLDFVTK